MLFCCHGDAFCLGQQGLEEGRRGQREEGQSEHQAALDEGLLEAPRAPEEEDDEQDPRQGSTKYTTTVFSMHFGEEVVEVEKPKRQKSRTITF